jgi:hypothetical protein
MQNEVTADTSHLSAQALPVMQVICWLEKAQPAKQHAGQHGHHHQNDYQQTVNLSTVSLSQNPGLQEELGVHTWGKRACHT